MLNITYGLANDGMVISRYGSEFAIPVLDFLAIGRGGRDTDMNTGKVGDHVYVLGDFNGPTRYDLTKFVSFVQNRQVVWTRKLPRVVKNYHREFWGMRPLTGPEVLVPCEKCRKRMPVTEAAAYRILPDPMAWSRLHHICVDCYVKMTQKSSQLAIAVR